MGGGIAMCFANAGIPVTLVEVKQEALDRGMAVVEKNYRTAVSRGSMAEGEVAKRMALFTPTTDWNAIADADVVIEAVFETMEVKREVFTKLDAIAKPGAVAGVQHLHPGRGPHRVVHQAAAGRAGDAFLLPGQRDEAAGDRARQGQQLRLAGPGAGRLAMAGAWLVQRMLRNAGWVDAIWSFATGAAGVAGALGPGDGIGTRQVVVAMLAGAWALRLGAHLARRTAGKPEDARYAGFRRDWGERYESRMFWFLQIQAAAALVLAVVVLIAAHNPARGLQVGDVAAVLVLLVALAGEAVADGQLHRWRADPAHRGGICDVGLWRWSRHPNYFFEWLIWVAFALFALPFSGGYPWGWAALAGPVLMYWLLVHVSGIPPLEAQMRASRGGAFEAYAARTSAFFPVPPG